MSAPLFAVTASYNRLGDLYQLYGEASVIEPFEKIFSLISVIESTFLGAFDAYLVADPRHDRAPIVLSVSAKPAAF
jgi:hypothetical protein